MPARAIELETTLAYAQGGYTVAAALGQHGDCANLLLDTGSSTLAVRPGAYDAGRDGALQATPWVQDISYGGGAWAGPVLRSRLAFGHGHHARAIDDALFALIETDGAVFREADGIWGLAYRDLDPAYDVSGLLAAQGHQPALSWPWPYASGHDLDLAQFKRFLREQPRTCLTPAFSALEEEGVVRNRFGLTVGRAVAHVQDGATTARRRAADPLNRGVLVLGGGSEQQHLYRGGFQDVRILHDLYYNANLRWLRIGDDAAIPVPPLADADVPSRCSNALLDTGSSFLALERSVYDAMVRAFAEHDASFPGLIDRARQALAAGEGLPQAMVHVQRWPDLHLVLEAPGGGDTVLRVPASHYWPANALRHGQALCLLAPQPPHFPRQSILGLPLFAGKYGVFDRTADGGLGVVRLAQARE